MTASPLSLAAMLFQTFTATRMMAQVRSSNVNSFCRFQQPGQSNGTSDQSIAHLGIASNWVDCSPVMDSLFYDLMHSPHVLILDPPHDGSSTLSQVPPQRPGRLSPASAIRDFMLRERGSLQLSVTMTEAHEEVFGCIMIILERSVEKT